VLCTTSNGMRDKNIKIFTVLVFAVSIVVLGFFVSRNDEPAYASLDEFAQCLSEQGATLYGAYWCPHCQNEKKSFGDSIRYINYVECTEEPGRCTEAQVRGYPTWIFGNGKKLEGEQGLERLSLESGCPINPSVEISPLPQ